jgi:hypothetical protein
MRIKPTLYPPGASQRPHEGEPENRLAADAVVPGGTDASSTGTGRRTIDLDARTVVVIRAWRKALLAERLLVGPAFLDQISYFRGPTVWRRGAAVRRCGYVLRRSVALRVKEATE